jgi:hypothetical protein
MLCERLDLGQLCIAHDRANPLKVAPAWVGEAERARRTPEQRRPHPMRCSISASWRMIVALGWPSKRPAALKEPHSTILTKSAIPERSTARAIG